MPIVNSIFRINYQSGIIHALDEEGTELVHKIVKEEKEKGKTIIVATHHQSDLMAMCDEILKINQGKIVERS